MNTRHDHSHTRSSLASIAVAIPAILIGSGLFAPAQAALIETLAENVRGGVFASGTGTLDLADLSLFITNSFNFFPEIIPNQGTIVTGATIADGYTGTLTGPSSFGSGAMTVASFSTGDTIAIFCCNEVIVPAGYVSGNPLNDTASWQGFTFSTLGVTPGTYEWTWGSGAHADSFTLQIGPAAVPALLIGRGLLVLLAVVGVLFGSKLLERSKRNRLQCG